MSWDKFYSGCASLFVLTTGTLLMVSVPTGMHALHISKRLPLVFTIFIYLEVFMSALHVIQVLIDRILYVYSNDKDLLEQMNQLPNKPQKPKKEKHHKAEINPYARAMTGFKHENTRASLKKRKGADGILKEFGRKKLKTKKQRSDFDIWGIIKARSNDSFRIEGETPKLRTSNLEAVFSDNVLSKLNKRSSAQLGKGTSL